MTLYQGKIRPPQDALFATPSDSEVITSSTVQFFFRNLFGNINEQFVIEKVKRAFGAASTSTNLEWALSDLQQVMRDKSNVVAFLSSLWEALRILESADIPVPSLRKLNQWLEQTEINYVYAPPHIRPATVDAVFTEDNSGVDGNIVAGRYLLVRPEIGSGGFGCVYRATRRVAEVEFEYAIKVFKPHPFIENTEKARNRFVREIATVSRLQHRGVVPYLDAGKTPKGEPFLVMPLIVGKTLALWARGKSTGHILRVVIEILDALDYMHRQGVHHRDLKPSNIIVRDSDEQPIILDFGLAFRWDVDTESSLTTGPPGTPGYIPWEVVHNWRERSVGHDVYALAVVLYELIASKRPDPMAYEPLVTSHDVPNAVDEILRRMICERTERDRGPGEFRRELQSALCDERADLS
jgi:hypothetical protein